MINIGVNKDVNGQIIMSMENEEKGGNKDLTGLKDWSYSCYMLL